MFLAQFHQRCPELWLVATGLGLIEHGMTVGVGQVQHDRLQFR